MKLKDSELKAILAEVEGEIATLLKSEGDALRKAKDENDEGSDPSASAAPAEGSESPAEEASEPAPGEGAPPVDAAPDASATDPSASPAPDASASPAPDASASPAPDASADPAADAGPVDPAALQAEYAKLPPEELKMHYMAAKAALFELMGAGGGAGPDASATPAPAPAPAASPSPAPAASPSPAPVPPPALKAEVPATFKNNPANGGTESAAVPDAIKKSEEKVADLEQQVALMAKALDIALGTPVRKAVTSVNHIPRTEEPAAPAKELSKSEIKDRIRTAVSSGKLSKSQKDLLFSYSLGNVNFDQVKDLLEVK